MQESVTLYYREGRSDKVYTAGIEERGSGYTVNFSYGRRGSTMQTGTKTPAPVPYPDAKKIFEKVVREKQAKGYTAGQSGSPYQDTERSGRSTGILPQLQNAIEEDEVEHLLDDPKYWMQEKLDGQRVLILKKGDDITGINRNGLTVALSETVVLSVRQLLGDYLLDGEALGDAYCAFDLIGCQALDPRKLPFSSRWEALRRLITDTKHLRVVPVAINSAEKRSRYGLLKRLDREGVVFKQKDALYVPGRPNTGGTQLKFKFCATASLIVAKGRPGKRSVALELMDGAKRVTAGNVTIPPNVPMPVPGSIVEVRYLYAYRESGHIFQPVFLSERDDISSVSCTVKQLKYRSEDQEKQ